MAAVRWYLRDGLSYRDVEELLAERGVEVDPVTVYRWVQRSRRCWPTRRGSHGVRRVTAGSSMRRTRRSPGYGGTCTGQSTSTAKSSTCWYLLAATRKFFTRALKALRTVPVGVVTDAAAVYPVVLADLVPASWHHVEQYANNPVEADDSRLKHRLRPMRGLRTDRTAQTVIAGHAFVQNLRRGHYEIAADTASRQRLATAFTELATAISPRRPARPNASPER
ncbi:IS6 family transposase [Winogradskya humida]|uniref:IS6 family transposase n=1 Tax=Winogradskya humida TaxID=113566 RepID=A0ABQ4A263_9ACTN|nr:IS6 family transposase [Actinoplanes humidus]